MSSPASATTVRAPPGRRRRAITRFGTWSRISVCSTSRRQTIACGCDRFIPASPSTTSLPQRDSSSRFRAMCRSRGSRPGTGSACSSASTPPANGSPKSPMSDAQPLVTRLTELVGVRYPIVQTGMGWVATPKLAAATSAAGGLGILAAATMSLDELRRAVKEVRERTDAPFGVNMRADQADVAERVDLLVREGVRLASFAMAPKRELIKRLQDGGVLVMPSIGAKRHAEKVAEWGVDAILVQGGEGGGHTGQVPTSLLLPQVVDTVDVPVVAAGGYFDGRGLVAALSYGASGVAMGTRFLLTTDSPVPDAVKQHYLAKSVTDTIVTRQVDGVPHRVLRSELVDALESAGVWRRTTGAVRSAVAFKKMAGTPWREIVREGLAMRKSQELTWSQVLMATNTPMLLRAAMVEGRDDLGVMAAGQVVGLIDDLPTCEALVHRIVRDAQRVVADLVR